MRIYLVLSAFFVAGLLPQAPSPHAEALKPLGFLAGSCWIGTFPDGKSTDEHCFEWMYGGKFLRDRHVVHGAPNPYAGESVFGWDAKDKKVKFWYFNSIGDHSMGTAEFTADAIVFPERHVTEQGVIVMKALWRRDGADAYVVTQQRLNDDDDSWRTIWTMRLTRKKQ